MSSIGDVGGAGVNSHRFSAAQLAVRLQDLILRNSAFYTFSIRTSVQCVKQICKRGDGEHESSMHITVTGR